MGLSSAWCDFLSSRCAMGWCDFSHDEPQIWIFPRSLFFRTYHITHESVQSDDFCVEVSGCCRLHTRQSMPCSAQVPGGASLAGSRLGGTSCHGPWWWESKCLSSWIWRWDQQQMRRDFTWSKIPLEVQSEDFGNFMQFFVRKLLQMTGWIAWL